jgi:hypothetical protein
MKKNDQRNRSCERCGHPICEDCEIPLNSREWERHVAARELEKSIQESLANSNNPRTPMIKRGHSRRTRYSGSGDPTFSISAKSSASKLTTAREERDAQLDAYCKAKTLL